MAKKVLLSQKERAVIVLFSERYEGTRVEIRRMDKALDVIDNGVADLIVKAPLGVQLDVGAMDDVEESFVFEDDPFNTLKTFLKDQRIPYSRRPNTVGRVMMTVMDKIDAAETIDLGKKDDG